MRRRRLSAIHEQGRVKRFVMVVELQVHKESAFFVKEALQLGTLKRGFAKKTLVIEFLIRLIWV